MVLTPYLSEEKGMQGRPDWKHDDGKADSDGDGEAHLDGLDDEGGGESGEDVALHVDERDVAKEPYRDVDAGAEVDRPFDHFDHPVEGWVGEDFVDLKQLPANDSMCSGFIFDFFCWFYWSMLHASTMSLIFTDQDGVILMI